MHNDAILLPFFLIFTTAAVLATFALFTRQPLIVAYILVGILLGPSAIGLSNDPTLISGISHIGIIFLLFLLGLDMQPSKLANMFGRSLLVGLVSCSVFFALGAGTSLLFGFDTTSAVIVGVAMMFSSTIIGIKLLPTTVLHHRQTGELVVALLLIQDLIAIVVLLVLTGNLWQSGEFLQVAQVLITLPLLIGGAYLFVRFVLLKLLARFDAFHEYVFLLAIGWCMGLAEISHYCGLSHEIGAFIAGVAIATSPIALYIADHLKPLRDFFLVLFFFSVGAGFTLALLPEIIVPALILTFAVLVVKPTVFRLLLDGATRSAGRGWEIGFRLGQISEFSLLIAFLAVAQGMLEDDAAHLIQATAILTFLFSSYLVVFRYPSPIAVDSRLRKD
ncbi:MAG: cation:proton antiporter [Pseudomonadales bacterium]|nr:cation:proton antiporter [Pseudomonadales bacterium]